MNSAQNYENLSITRILRFMSKGFLLPENCIAIYYSTKVLKAKHRHQIMSSLVSHKEGACWRDSRLFWEKQAPPNGNWRELKNRIDARGTRGEAEENQCGWMSESSRTVRLRHVSDMARTTARTRSSSLTFSLHNTIDVTYVYVYCRLHCTRLCTLLLYSN